MRVVIKELKQLDNHVSRVVTGISFSGVLGAKIERLQEINSELCGSLDKLQAFVDESQQITQDGTDKITALIDEMKFKLA